MKIRSGFVANSSSSSFIIVTLGKNVIYEQGNIDYGDPDYASMDIDILIEQLQEAKEKGIKTIEFEYGGGYDG